MPTASTLRSQIEASLADRIPSALTPVAATIRPVAPTGIANVDQLLQGGLPVGAITEIVGPQSSGRTSLTLSFVATLTQATKVCAWIDVSDALDPESAAAAGVDLSRLLWVRCGVDPSTPEVSPPIHRFTLPGKYIVPPIMQKGLHGGGHGPHPRTEIKGMDSVVSDLLSFQAIHSNCFDPQCKVGEKRARLKSDCAVLSDNGSTNYQFDLDLYKSNRRKIQKSNTTPLARLSQGLRATDLLLQTGGFSCIVLDMASIAPEKSSQVPLATWFRYRVASERTRASFILLTQYPTARSSAALVLQLAQGKPIQEASTFFTGISYDVHIQKERFTPERTNLIPLRKPPQSERTLQSTSWQTKASWAGPS